MKVDALARALAELRSQGKSALAANAEVELAQLLQEPDVRIAKQRLSNAFDRYAEDGPPGASPDSLVDAIVELVAAYHVDGRPSREEPPEDVAAAWERVSYAAWLIAGHELERMPVDDDIQLLSMYLGRPKNDGESVEAGGPEAETPGGRLSVQGAPDSPPPNADPSAGSPTQANCRGCKSLGTACGRCPRCRGEVP